MDTRYLGTIRALRVNLSHKQVDGLADLSWNAGPGVIEGGLAELLRAHDWGAAAIYIRRYSYANGEFLPGLYSRRLKDGALLQVVERPESEAQRRARERRELATAEGELAYLRHRIVILRRELRVKGCDARVKAHKPTGPTCARWRREGGVDHAKGRVEDREVARLKRALG